MISNLRNEIIKAAKWSSFTEIAAKIVSPVTNMVLARILAPEAFGIVATVTMITSFSDMFTDAGFQKYLIQHEFQDQEDLYYSANVAFWTNCGISFLLWGVIAVFSKQLAALVGSPGFGNVITIACMQIPITSISSIQTALYRRDFDFKALFFVRIISVCIPFVVTIPLAFLGFRHWALIIGTIVIQLSNSILLTVKSKWKPMLFYSVLRLKIMFSFSIWSLLEATAIWLTAWIDTFMISNSFSQYELGIYKTSTSMVNAIMAIITASTVPVLYSALSRLQDNDMQFEGVFLKFQRMVSVIIFPLGIGVYLYRELATSLLLGKQWKDASGIIGIWALSSSVVIVFGYYCSEVYRAKGRPRLSLVSQLLHLSVLIPACIISSRYGFWTLVYTRSFIRLETVLVHFIIMKAAIGISFVKIIRNILPAAASSAVMGICGCLLQKIGGGAIWEVISIGLCALIYFGTLVLHPGMRKELLEAVRKTGLYQKCIQY